MGEAMRTTEFSFNAKHVIYTVGRFQYNNKLISKYFNFTIKYLYAIIYISN